MKQFGMTQSLASSGCPRAEVVHDFSLDKYKGVWYEMLRSNGNDFESGDCVTANYTLRDDGYIRVLNSQQKRDADSNELLERDYAEGWAKFRVNETVGKLGVKFSEFQPSYANYDVIDTDYDSYALIYHCHEGLLSGYTELAWILTREPRIFQEQSSEFQQKVKATFTQKVPGFNFDKLFEGISVVQGEANGCDYSYTYK